MKRSFKKVIAWACSAALLVAGMTGYQAKSINAADDWGINKITWAAAGETGNMQCDVSYDYKDGYTNYSLYLGEVADDNLARNYGASWLWAKGASNNGMYDGVYNRNIDGNNATPYWNVGDTVTMILVAFDGALTEVDRDVVEVVVGENFTKVVTSLKVSSGAVSYNETHNNYSVPITTPEVAGAASYSFYVGEIDEANYAKAPDGFAFNKTNQHNAIPVVVPIGTSTIYGVAYDANGEVLLQGSTTVTLEYKPIAASDVYTYLSPAGPTIVSVQQPPWAAENGVYMHVPAGINSVTVNGNTENVATIDGAGTVVHLSALSKPENTVVIAYAGGTATVIIKNANGTEGGEEPTNPGEQPTEEEPTSAPSGGSGSDYSGLTYTQVGTTDYYVAAGNDGFPLQLLEDQGTQMLIIPGVATGNEPIWPDFANATLNGEAFNQIAGAGIYIPYELLNDNAYNVFEATSAVTNARFQIIIKAGNPTSGDAGVTIDAGVNVIGWQVSCGALSVGGKTYDGGIRTVYAIDDTVAGMSTAGATVGLVYGLAGSATEADMVVGSTSDYVTSTVATNAGKIAGNYGQNADSTLYAVIMASNLSKATAASVQKEYMVRAYVEIDGTYYYSDVATYSVYNVAKSLYDAAMMQTAAGHEYVYNILTKVDANYPQVPFGQKGDTVVGASEE